MHSTSIFPCIMAMISSFAIFFIFQIFIFRFFFTNITDFCIFQLSSLRVHVDSQNFFIQDLPLHTLCLFYMLLNEDIVDIKKPDAICLLTFIVDAFSGLFLHPSICMNNKCYIRFLTLIEL